MTSLMSIEPEGLRALMDANAKRVGARQEGLAFYVANLSGEIARITVSRDWTPSGMLWHFSASIGAGPHGTASTRAPTDTECEEIGQLMRCGYRWEEEPCDGGNPHVRHFWQSST